MARAALLNPQLNLIDNCRDRAGPLEVSTFGTNRTGRERRTIVDQVAAATEPRTASSDGAHGTHRPRRERPARGPCARHRRPRELLCPQRQPGATSPTRATGSRCRCTFTAWAVVLRPRSPSRRPGAGHALRRRLRGRARTLPREGRRRGEGRDRAEVRRPRRCPQGDQSGPQGRRPPRDPIFMPTKEDAQNQKAENPPSPSASSRDGGDRPRCSPTRPSKTAQVVDRKLKVLVIDSLPRFDFKFLQPALGSGTAGSAKKGRISISPRRPAADEGRQAVGARFAFGRDEFRKELFEYDLLILGDVPATFFDPEQQEVIKQFVAKGGGHDPHRRPLARTGGVGESPIADVLPVEFEPSTFPIDRRHRPTGRSARPGPGRVRTRCCASTTTRSTSPPAGGSLPEIYWNYPVTKLKPATEVFLTHPTQKTTDGKPMPLVAGHYYGKGYVLFVGSTKRGGGGSTRRTSTSAGSGARPCTSPACRGRGHEAHATLARHARPATREDGASVRPAVRPRVEAAVGRRGRGHARVKWPAARRQGAWTP